MKNRFKFNTAKSFAVYYGHDNIENLINSDLVIVEPLGQSQSNIDYMKQRETIVIAYISLLEISKHSVEYEYLREEDFLKVNGERIINKDYDNYLVDLRSKRWKAMLIQKIGDLVLNKGYHGIFLDTVGDIEFDIVPNNLKDSMINALVNLLLEIKSLFKDCIIIQNNGIVELIKYTGSIVDGVVWENSCVKAFEYSDYEMGMLEYIGALKNEYNIKVFMLFDEENISKGSKDYDIIDSVCKEKDLLFHVASKNYL